MFSYLRLGLMPILQIVFIGLFGLTMSRALVIHFWHKRLRIRYPFLVHHLNINGQLPAHKHIETRR